MKHLTHRVLQRICNLGKPLYSTLFNWVKDGVVMLPFCIFGAAFYGSAGVVYGQGLAYIFAGIISVVFGWWFISRVEKLHKKVI